MKRVLGRLVVGLLTFLAGLWWYGVISNPWVISKYHRGDLIESSFLLVAGAICCGLAVAGMSANGGGANRTRAYTLLMFVSGLLILFLGMQKFASMGHSVYCPFD